MARRERSRVRREQRQRMLKASLRRAVKRGDNIGAAHVRACYEMEFGTRLY